MKFVLASNNEGKKAEMLRIIRPLIPEIEIVTAREAGFGSVDPEETGVTFAENAEIKARAFMELTGLPAIADDSGLCVDAMGGAPGVHTARYAGDHDFDAAMDKLLGELKDVPLEERGASFVSAICCVWPDGRMLTAEGRCCGYIGFEKGGKEGFGFDPVFYMPDGRCFGGIPGDEKDIISHRGNSMREFADKLKKVL